MASYVQYVNSDGDLNYDDCDYDSNEVRPFWDGRRNRVRNCLKLESHHQKSRQPFLPEKWQDKYKGMKYYDRK